MRTLKKLFAVLAVAMLSSAVLADTDADDRSYLPPQYLQAQSKVPHVEAAPQGERRIRNTRYESHRHNARGAGLPGILRSLFH